MIVFANGSMAVLVLVLFSYSLRAAIPEKRDPNAAVMAARVRAARACVWACMRAMAGDEGATEIAMCHVVCNWWCVVFAPAR